MALAVSVVGEDELNCHQIGGSVLMVEPTDDQLNDFLQTCKVCIARAAVNESVCEDSHTECM